MCKPIMAVKPLNLSIVLGDTNKAPEIKSREGIVLLSPKSRIPVARSTGVFRTPARGSTTFRQWADPPPPPTRSRTVERKSSHNHPPKRRPGSVDSRFRRTLETAPKEISIAEKFKTFTEVKKEFLNSAKEFSHVKNLVDATKEKKLSPRNKDQTSQVSLEPAESLVEKQVHATDASVDTAAFKEMGDLYKVETKEEAVFEKFENHRNADHFNPLRSGLLDIIEPRFLKDKDDAANSLTTNRYSQTDISFAEIENYSSSSSEFGKNDFEFRDKESSRENVHRQQDSLILDRTRSLDDMRKESSSNERRSKRRRIPISDVNQYMNKTPYIRYMEVWTVVLTTVIMLICTWYFLVPLIHEFILDVYTTYINPPPVFSPAGILVETVKNIVKGFKDVLTASSHKRMKWVSFS